MNNPYRLNIGSEPETYIPNPQIETICDYFKIHSGVVLTGVSGCGKTVAMIKVSKKLKQSEDWIVVNLKPVGPLMIDLVGKLYDTHSYIKNFMHTELNITPFDVGMIFKTNPPAASLESALYKILKEIKEKKQKLLVCIDEAASTIDLVEFLNSFQTLSCREQMPIYILIAGLDKNIDDLRGHMNLSFFCRFPEIILDPLSTELISTDYKQKCVLDSSEALRYSRITKGFPTAFQLLGNILYEHRVDLEAVDVIEELNQKLYKQAYRELINELNDAELDYLNNLLNNESPSTQDVTQRTKIIRTRNRLQRKGVIKSIGRSLYKEEIILPQFAEIYKKVMDGIYF